MRLSLGLRRLSIRQLMKGNRVKNIEKYPETAAALDAYNSLGLTKVPFNEWLECEYELMHPFTTLEAAQSVIDEWYATGPDVNDHSFGLKIIALENAIDREKSKPVRNFDKYRTEKEACEGFREMCGYSGIHSCDSCRFRDCDGISGCAIAYLYAEAKKEVK